MKTFYYKVKPLIHALMVKAFHKAVDPLPYIFLIHFPLHLNENIFQSTKIWQKTMQTMPNISMNLLSKNIYNILFLNFHHLPHFLIPLASGVESLLQYQLLLRNFLLECPLLILTAMKPIWELECILEIHRI